jgi:hypothetical protein
MIVPCSHIKNANNNHERNDKVPIAGTEPHEGVWRGDIINCREVAALEIK